MGRIEWFRRWRYEESASLAQDQELLLRSYRDSCFANLPLVLLGYRRERVTLRKLCRYKLLHIQHVCRQPGVLSGREKLQLLLVTAARFGANCVAILMPERRLGHQAAQMPSSEELAQWRTLWNILAHWYGRPSNEIFVPASVAPRAKDRASRR